MAKPNDTEGLIPPPAGGVRGRVMPGSFPSLLMRPPACGCSEPVRGTGEGRARLQRAKVTEHLGELISSREPGDPHPAGLLPTVSHRFPLLPAASAGRNARPPLELRLPLTPAL